MKRLLMLALVTGLLTGCVTETRINGQEKPQTEKKLDKNAAAKTRLSLALRYLEAGDAEQAKRNLDMAADLAPNLIDVYITEAYFQQQVRQPERALTAYQKALRIDPNNGDVLNNYGVMLCREGNFELAEEQFEKALSNPSYVEVAATNENAGLCAYNEGELDKAFAYFNSALAYNARRPTSVISAADISLKQKNYQQARVYLQHYDRIAKASPQSLFAWIRLESAEDNFADEARWGMELQQSFPNSEQTKQYIANDY